MKPFRILLITHKDGGIHCYYPAINGKEAGEVAASIGGNMFSLSVSRKELTHILDKGYYGKKPAKEQSYVDRYEAEKEFEILNSINL